MGEFGDPEDGFGDVFGAEGFGDGFRRGWDGAEAEDFGVDEAGADDAGADAVLFFLGADGVGEAEEAAFGGLVGGAGG